MKQYQPNPLNLFGLRQLQHSPPHFYAVDFDLSTGEKRISDWIWENLTGRFFIGDVFVNDDKGKTQVKKRVSFEIHSEASYFSLLLNDLNKF